jgi:hypothetical protein
VLGQTDIGRRLTPTDSSFLTPGTAGNGFQSTRLDPGDTDVPCYALAEYARNLAIVALNAHEVVVLPHGIPAPISPVTTFVNRLADHYIGTHDSLRMLLGHTRGIGRGGQAGFRDQFQQPADPNANQVRHYVAGVLIGHNNAASVGYVFTRMHEVPADPDFLSDTALNRVSTKHGAGLRDPRDLADLILRDVCK